MRYYLIALFIVLLFGIVGQMDYEDAKQDQATYCENVKSGLWPDYRKEFKKYCE